MNLPPVYPADHFANDYRINAEYRWDSQAIELRLIHYHGLGGRAISVGAPIEMKPYDPASYMPPTLLLRTETAQHLMDSLWRCGLRPTEGTGSAGALAATQRHLDDLRKIVFKELEIEDQANARRS